MASPPLLEATATLIVRPDMVNDRVRLKGITAEALALLAD
jgi:hypothetical protein